MRPLAIAVAALSVAVTISLVVGVLALVKVGGVAQQGARDASDARHALCALRNDLETRAATSRAFLRDHPDGIPGISAKAIREGIANQERTIRALSSLDCK